MANDIGIEDKLKKYVDHWNDRVAKWLAGGLRDQRYLPEPWWGALPTRDNHLMSVVMNLSPGEGSLVQERHIVSAAFGEKKYSEAMADGTLRGLLPATHKWHSVRRAKPVVEAVTGNPGMAAESCICHHLSIEICPYHKPPRGEKSGDHIAAYINSNSDEAEDFLLAFAAEASRMIDGALNRKVIVRYTASKFSNLFKDLAFYPANGYPSPDNADGIQWLVTNDESLRDVVFVCVSDTFNRLSRENVKSIINRKTNQ